MDCHGHFQFSRSIKARNAIICNILQYKKFNLKLLHRKVLNMIRTPNGLPRDETNIETRVRKVLWPVACTTGSSHFHNTTHFAALTAADAQVVWQTESIVREIHVNGIIMTQSHRLVRTTTIMRARLQIKFTILHSVLVENYLWGICSAILTAPPLRPGSLIT